MSDRFCYSKVLAKLSARETFEEICAPNCISVWCCHALTLNFWVDTGQKEIILTPWEFEGHINTQVVGMDQAISVVDKSLIFTGSSKEDCILVFQKLKEYSAVSFPLDPGALLNHDQFRSSWRENDQGVFYDIIDNNLVIVFEQNSEHTSNSVLADALLIRHYTDLQTKARSGIVLALDRFHAQLQEFQVKQIEPMHNVLEFVKTSHALCAILGMDFSSIVTKCFPGVHDLTGINSKKGAANAATKKKNTDPLTIILLMRFSGLDEAIVRVGGTRNIAAIHYELFFHLKVGDCSISIDSMILEEFSDSNLLGLLYVHVLTLTGCKEYLTSSYVIKAWDPGSKWCADCCILKCNFVLTCLSFNHLVMSTLNKERTEKYSRYLFVFPYQPMSFAQVNCWYIVFIVRATGPKQMDNLGLSLFRLGSLICYFSKLCEILLVNKQFTAYSVRVAMLLTLRAGILALEAHTDRMEIHFYRDGRIIGANFGLFSLERLQCYQFLVLEGTYYYFYLLCKVTKEEIQRCKLGDLKSFHHLTQLNCYDLVGVRAAHAFLEIRMAMVIFIFSEKEHGIKCKVVASVCHLGYISFAKGKRSNSSYYNADKSGFPFYATIATMDKYSSLNKCPAMMFVVLYSNLEDKVLIESGGIVMNGKSLLKGIVGNLANYIWDPG